VGCLQGVWYFIMDEICAIIYHFHFDRSDPLVLFLNEDVMIFAGVPKQLIMQCVNILAHRVDMPDI
jgi:hypothetical protein